jgi:spermidine synthase
MTASAGTHFPQRRPFASRRHGMLSLHFNYLGTQSEMRCDAPQELVVPYTQTMMGFLLFKQRPEKIVMVGLGGGSIPKYCYAKIPEASVLTVEIDPDVVGLRDLFCVPQDDERFQVLCADGADFVRNASNCVDVLLVDGFDMYGPAAQLCTQAFYDDCFRSLVPDGMLVVNLTVEDPHAERSVARIRHRFPNAVVVESQDGANRVVFASRGRALDLPHPQLCARLEELEPIHPVGLRDTLQRIRYEQYTSSAERSARGTLSGQRQDR